MDGIMTKKENKILNQIHDVSDDNDSELSFSDLINEYNSNRLRSINISDLEQKSSCSDNSYVKVDLDYKLSYNTGKNTSKEPLNLKLDVTLAEEIQSGTSETNKFDKASSENDSSLGKHSDITFEENFDINLVLSEKTVIKWAAQLLLALEKLHILGVICR